MSRRAFVVVLDACGVGALPDAGDYAGDAGSNTLVHLAEDVGGLDLPVLGRPATLEDVGNAAAFAASDRASAITASAINITAGFEVG